MLGAERLTLDARNRDRPCGGSQQVGLDQPGPPAMENMGVNIDQVTACGLVGDGVAVARVECGRVMMVKDRGPMGVKVGRDLSKIVLGDQDVEVPRTSQTRIAVIACEPETLEDGDRNTSPTGVIKNMLDFKKAFKYYATRCKQQKY